MVSRDDGDVDRALTAAAATIDAIYTLPYLAHAAMEPNNAACRMRDDGTLHDPTTEAVHVARALDWKHPVKVQSLREEDFKTGRYRAMAAHRVRAGADAAGRLTAMHHEMVAEPTSVNMPYVRDALFTGGVDF